MRSGEERVEGLVRAEPRGGGEVVRERLVLSGARTVEVGGGEDAFLDELDEVAYYSGLRQGVAARGVVNFQDEEVRRE